VNTCIEENMLNSLKLLHVHRNKDVSRGMILRRYNPVRIRVRIDPPHLLVRRKRRLNGAVLRMRPEKPRSRVTAGVVR
jgi:hypothetical protein